MIIIEVKEGKIEEEIIQILQHDIKMNYNDFTLRELDHEFNKIKTQQPSSELGGHISVSSIKDQLNP